MLYDKTIELEKKLAAAPEDSEELAETMAELAWATWTLDLPAAEHKSRDALALAQKYGYDRADALAKRNLGSLFGAKIDIEVSIRYLNEAMQWFTEHNEVKGQGDIHLGLGFRYWSFGDFQKGLEHTNNALTLYKQVGEKNGFGWALTALGGFYRDWKDHEQSREYYERAIRVFEETDNAGGVARSLNGIGNAIFLLGKHEEALHYQERSLAACDDPGHELAASKTMTDIGLILEDQGKFDKALEYHQKSLDIRHKYGYNIGEATCLLDIGNIFLQKHQYEKARKFLDKALVLALEINSKPKACRAHELLSNLFRDTGQWDVALEHFDSFHRIHEETYHDDADTRFKNMQAVYQLEAAERDAEIYRLKNVELKQTLTQLQTAQAQLLQSGKMAALGKLVAGITHEVNTPVSVIQSASDGNSRALRKLEQYIGESSSKAPPELGQLVDVLRTNINMVADGAGRIGTILKSLKTYSRLDESSFQKADIHEGINSALTLIGVELPEEVNVVKEFGEVETCYHFPGELNQVFMNLLMNALHALGKKGKITIRTWSTDGFVNIAIADTGKGIPRDKHKTLFDPGFTTRNARVRMRTGLYSSYNIVQKHHGDIHLDSGPDKGTTFTITFPENLETIVSQRTGAARSVR